MRLAITGATGFVGAAVLAEAARRGWTVRALARRTQAARAGVEWLPGDLDDTRALGRLAEGADAVIHIAGVVNAPDPAQFLRGNVIGTANALAAAKQAGVSRFVYVSSLAARRPGLSLYGTSKARAEGLVTSSLLDWAMVRPPWVYGPGDKDSLDLFKAAQRGIVPVPGRARNRVSMLHVDDCARLVLALAEAPAARPRYRLEPDDGQPGGWSHAEVAGMLGAAVGRRARAVALPGWALRLAARADRLARGARARLTLDRVSYMLDPDWVVRGERCPAAIWVPQMPTPQGLAETARWYRDAGWL